MTSSNPAHEDAGDAPASGAQAELRRLRQNVLAGRGPGASRSEFLRHTRGRTLVGGRPVPQQREAVAAAAAAARRDPDQLLLHVVSAQREVAADLDELRAQRENSPRSPGATVFRALRGSRVVRRTVLCLMALAAGRSMWRRTR